MACAFGANLMMNCYGLVVPASAFMIPQMEDSESDFGISLDEGSWLGMYHVWSLGHANLMIFFAQNSTPKNFYHSDTKPT